MTATSIFIDGDAQRALVAAQKPQLRILPTVELNAETPAHLLDGDITPTARLFARNAGTMPLPSAAEIAAWTLVIDGCVRTRGRWTIDELQRRFETVTRTAVLECAGNGRSFFPEPAGVVLWQHGAAGCVAWTGVRLADLLAACEVRPDAVYTGHHSPDMRFDGEGPAISRGLPIAKALSPETLVAWALNGEPIPPLHGGPLRVIAPGFPGSASQKWITRIEVRDREHDGERMLDLHYRLPRVPVRPLAPGERYDEALFDVITDVPVRAVVTAPREGFALAPGAALAVRGRAWSGHTPLAKVELSLDGGTSWQLAKLGPLPDTFAWRRFSATLAPPPAGAIEIIARASDASGRMQPLESAPWNPRGYCNNTVHRVRGRIA
ncbi:MAG TPA: sulfite oxidase [Xanthobacteraceae bacterium]|nr:sulfite oxidase [Xanthobacteraceae bacterium]